MPLSKKLERKLRATEDDSDASSYWEVSDRSSPSIVDTGEGPDIRDTDSSDREGPDDEEMSDVSDDDRYQQQLSKVSFGALAKAQDAISRKRKRGEDTSVSQENKLEALRERLHELKAEKIVKDSRSNKKAKMSPKAEEGEDSKDEEAGSHSDSDGAPRARSSKHAPAVQSSKRAVTRRRNVIDVKKPASRDPRFDPIAGRPDANTFKKRYAFLDDYKASEMAELRATIKKAKNEADKEKLRRKLLSMESQKKSQDTKEKQQEIVRDHKKQERELIKQGKKPFYLKKSEQKKLALIDRFQNMKPKQQDKVIERRRKKAAAKERKNMPAERRTA
ncbi:DUF947-domain-containing protein [Lojkania enalia]|uniref:rRNA biogenesis protein RRP36 n=1 Tax=Lojkania enalia TaxID=147567 RepID=A0A9P4KJQ7_9PLEO|nr:DUF947-domain-containing protein [Didymosphaeria enalia]